MWGGGTQSNKVHKFALNELRVSTVLSKIDAHKEERRATTKGTQALKASLL